MIDVNDVLQIIELLMLSVLIGFEIYKQKKHSKQHQIPTPTIPQTFPTPYVSTLPGMSLPHN